MTAAGRFDELDELMRTTGATAGLIVQHGEQVWRFQDASHDVGALLHTQSVTKLVVGIGIAHAVHAGDLASIDLPVATWLVEWQGTKREAITLRDLMLHRSGLEVQWPGPDGESPTSFALRREVVAPRGERVAYDNHGAQVVAEVLRRATAQDIDAYMTERVFEPLGVRRQWDWYDLLPFAMSNLELDIDSLATLTGLLLSRGVHDGVRYFDETWGDEARIPGETFGLMTMHVSQLDVVLDVAALEGHVPAATLAAVAPLHGVQLPFQGAGSVLLHLHRTLGSAYETWATIRQVRGCARAVVPEQIQAFGHDGSNGQHAFVIPEADAIAVCLRDIRQRDDGGPFQEVAFDALLG